MQIVGTLHMDVQFCPFKAAGEAAGQEAAKKQAKAAAAPQRKMMRRATTSIISPQHKGILTINVIGVTVCSSY